MMLKNRICASTRQIVNYLKDYHFNSILLKYFLMLLVCLVFPVTALNIWYGKQMRQNMRQEIMKQNEAALGQAYNNVNSVILSGKNLAYSLANHAGVKYLAVQKSIRTDFTGNTKNLQNMLSVILRANRYIDSVCVYFKNSSEFISDQGIFGLESYQDNDCLELYWEDMPSRTVCGPRRKNNNYPYLLTILYPMSLSEEGNVGAVVINIDVEDLGDYIGSGQYHNKDHSPMLLIFDGQMETLVYSDEYRLLDSEEVEEVRQQITPDWEDAFSGVYTLWNHSYVVSGIYSQQEGLRYLYLSSMHQFEMQNQSADLLLRNVTILTGIVCLVLASLLAAWVYRPIQRTIHVLDEMSMLTEWDTKEHLDEIETIQRSILSAKQEKDNLNEQIKERIISLHNAQICALQTQINPHFLYNTLEAIGNAEALLMDGENEITDMVYTLGKMMRVSLAGENYLVPLAEELEHVKLYVKLMDFRFKGKICMHIEIPEVLYQERIVKLTLQPLIENAIEHGLGRRRKQGNIWLKGEQAGDKNYIYVIDDGEGIQQEELCQLQEELKDSPINKSMHIGLRNVNQRLKLVFGEEYGLEVRTPCQGGLCVVVCYRKI